MTDISGQGHQFAATIPCPTFLTKEERFVGLGGYFHFDKTFKAGHVFLPFPLKDHIGVREQGN